MRLLPPLFPAKGYRPATNGNGNGHRPQAKTIPTVTYPPELFWDMPGNPSSDQTVSARRAFKIVSLVFACLTYRATKLTEPPVWIAEEGDDGERMIEGEHELSEILEQPNPDMDMAEFLTLCSLYLDVTGACLMVKNETRGGRVGSLYPYAKDEFAVEPANGRLYGAFKVQTLTGYRTFGPDEVIYLRRPATEHVMASVAPVDAALEHISIGQHMRTAIRAGMRNAVRPSAIFRSSKELGDDVYNRLNSEIRANWAGVTNHGKSILLEAIDEHTVLESSLQNLQLGPIQDDVEAAICQVFQIHPLLVGAKFGIQENSGFSDSIEPAQTLFYDLCAFPTWSWIEKKLTAGLLRPVDDNPRRFIRFDTSKVRALIPDVGEKVEQAAAAAAFWTVNEQRAHTGKPPIDGGDEIRVPVAPATPDEEDDAEEGDEPSPPKSWTKEFVRNADGVVVAEVMSEGRE
jgi:HK97 family phage portal protein